MTAKTLLTMIPAFQAAALAGENVKLVKKKDKSAEDFVGVGIKNIIGIELTKLTATEAEGFN